MMEDPIPELKERLAQSIFDELGIRYMYRAEQMLGLAQPEFSKLKHRHLEHFSIHKLIRLLAKLNRRVEFTIVAVGPLPTRFNRRSAN